MRQICVLSVFLMSLAAPSLAATQAVHGGDTKDHAGPSSLQKSHDSTRGNLIGNLR